MTIQTSIVTRGIRKCWMKMGFRHREVGTHHSNKMKNYLISMSLAITRSKILRRHAFFWYNIYCLSLSFYLCSSWHFKFDKISTIYYEIDEVDTGQSHSTEKLFLLFWCSLSTVSWVFWWGWLLWISDFHHWCPGLIMKTYGAQCHSVSRKKKGTVIIDCWSFCSPAVTYLYKGTDNSI